MWQKKSGLTFLALNIFMWDTGVTVGKAIFNPFLSRDLASQVNRSSSLPQLIHP